MTQISFPMLAAWLQQEGRGAGRHGLFVPASSLFRKLGHLLQVLTQWELGMEGAEEVVFFLGPFLLLPDVELQGFIAHHHIVLLGEGLQTGGQPGGVGIVQQKDTEEHADEEGEGQVPAQPVQSPQNPGVDQE